MKKVRWPRPGRFCMVIVMAVVWAVLLLGVAVPSWRGVQVQHREIQTLERQLADLDHWTVAGLWLEPVVAAREPGVAAAWYRLFPADRGREELFLHLAEVADRCGVREFQLEEITELGMFDQGTWSTTGALAEAGPAVDAPPDGGLTAAALASAPVIAFHPYLVRAAFTADYAQTAAFLGGLARVERAIEVRRLAIRPARSGVNVELELEVPVCEASSS